jgi:hypothetical protein
MIDERESRRPNRSGRLADLVFRKSLQPDLGRNWLKLSVYKLRRLH